MAFEAHTAIGDIYHDSRDAAYRFPGGARAAGSAVTLRLAAAADRVWLRAWVFDGELKYDMAHIEGGLFEATVRLPDAPCLFWYYFIVESGGERLYYGNAPDRLGGVGALWPGEPPSYQITVYDAAFKAPSWLGRGVIYQIMVDRFNIGGARRAPWRGYSHGDWREKPALRLDQQTGDNLADDFFGGNLAGVAEKLEYLRDLGVTAIYLNPIFRAPSNHKYDTVDYEEIDPSFGETEDFGDLCARAEALGIHIVLDGVFSHTGADSRYFRAARVSRDSEYFPWYRFKRWPEEYDCWWGFKTLPNVDELAPGYLDYIIRGEGAIAAKWLRAGASGWRLDVADELPMEFIRLLRARVKAENPDAALLGEVWEDASNKVSYGQPRSYCLGDTLDGCMNYPLRAALIDFLTGRREAGEVARVLAALYENYPPPFADGLMNLLDSHDRPRAITALSGAKLREGAREDAPLTEEQYALGRSRYIAAWDFISALPGTPCLYYGDEAGATGGGDPFCRGTYPWGREDRALMEAVRGINRAREKNPPRGEARFTAPSGDELTVERGGLKKTLSRAPSPPR